MSKFEYKTVTDRTKNVFRDGVQIGQICRQDRSGWIYYPREGVSTQLYPTITACKRAIESA
jgi:hypothetical protein